MDIGGRSTYCAPPSDLSNIRKSSRPLLETNLPHPTGFCESDIKNQDSQLYARLLILFPLDSPQQEKIDARHEAPQENFCVFGNQKKQHSLWENIQNETPSWRLSNGHKNYLWSDGGSFDGTSTQPKVNGLPPTIQRPAFRMFSSEKTIWQTSTTYVGICPHADLAVATAVNELLDLLCGGHCCQAMDLFAGRLGPGCWTGGDIAGPKTNTSPK